MCGDELIQSMLLLLSDPGFPRSGNDCDVWLPLVADCLLHREAVTPMKHGPMRADSTSNGESSPGASERWIDAQGYSLLGKPGQHWDNLVYRYRKCNHDHRIASCIVKRIQDHHVERKDVRWDFHGRTECQYRATHVLPQVLQLRTQQTPIWDCSS